MNNNLYLNITEELYKLTNDRKYLKEFIDKGQAGNVYTDNNNDSQWETLVKLTSSNEGEFGVSVIDWGIDDKSWQKALNLAKENKLKIGNASNENPKKQCIMQVMGLKQVNKYDKSNLKTLPTSYVKLNLDSNGKLDDKANGFRRRFGLFTKGLHFGTSSFTLTTNKDEASYLSEDDTRTFISTFNDLARRNNVNNFDSKETNADNNYYADNNTRIISSYVDSNAVKSTGFVNANFIIYTYLAKKNDLDLASLASEKDADSKILNKAKELDPSGIITAYLKEDSNITKSTIFSVIDKIKEYTKDNKEISKTLKTIYGLTQNSALDFDLKWFTDSSKFSSRLALSGILNNAKGGTGDAFAGYERIATTLTENRLNEKIIQLSKDFTELNVSAISRWLIFEKCNGEGSNQILDLLRSYCLNEINKNEFKAQAKFPSVFDIDPSNKATCKLRDLDTCQTYWKVFTTWTYEEKEESDDILKMYIGKYPVILNEVKKGIYELEAKKPIYLDGNKYISFSSSSTLKLDNNIEKSLPEYLKKVDKSEIYLIAERDLSLKKIIVKLKKDEEGLYKVSYISMEEFEAKDSKINKEETKETKSTENSSEKSPKKSPEKINKEETKETYKMIMVSAAKDSHQVMYKSSPNGKVYYKWNIHQPSGGKNITYVVDAGQDVYGVISRAEANKLDPNLPSEEDIKQDTRLRAQATGKKIKDNNK